MGVNPLPTGGIYKYFTFDGETSASFGVHLTGEGVYNAPERAVEMISIPARNGAFALDPGRFENIELEYTASIVADNETDFRTAVSEFRNFLCSKTGYCRLEDDYNPNEYRMAVYKSGLEVDPFTLRTGEFSIVFDCKPQRYLTSGETAISVTSGDTITNPTRFEAQPIIEATGYGTIDIDSAKIKVDNVPIGAVIVHDSEQTISTNMLTITIDDTYANVGDTITIGNVVDSTLFEEPGVGKTLTKGSTSVSGDVTSANVMQVSAASVRLMSTIANKQLNYGSTSTLTGTATLTANSSTYGTVTLTVTVVIAYNGTDTITITATNIKPSGFQAPIGAEGMQCGVITLYSTVSALGNPMYIDLAIGEAYKIEGGSSVSVNNSVTIPSELPTLASGANTITYDNTFTQFAVVPRWWKV